MSPWTAEPVQHCARCGRPAPDQVSDEFLYWEALDESGVSVVCPGCITPAEEQAMNEDTEAILAELAQEQAITEGIETKLESPASRDVIHAVTGVHGQGPSPDSPAAAGEAGMTGRTPPGTAQGPRHTGGDRPAMATREELLAQAVKTLTTAARLTQPVMVRDKAASASAGRPVWVESDQREPADWAEFVTQALAGAAANIGGVETILAGRPGSWEPRVFASC